MHVLIPCKNLDSGKSRLAECLNAAARRALCEQLLTQSVTLATALAAPAFVRVVTADCGAAAIAAAAGVAALPDSGGGLNAALELARAAVLRERADSIVVLPIDLPLATAGAVRQAVERACDVVICPDESGTGTNLLRLSRAALRHLPFRFGPGSYTAHLAAARESGLSVETVRDPRIAFDIDAPAHYAAWRARAARPAHSAAG
jgi:2-phospho-L-lactate guanylyltransferase